MITREFVLAGRAVFTVSNGRGEWYTFKVTHNGDYFVGLLSRPDNIDGYDWFGKLSESGTHIYGNPGHKTARVFQWAIRKIWSQSILPQGYEIRHAGRCGRCGRLLTTPDSIESGFGPDCRQKI